MKIAVVGCGAMGSVYAALLASAGNEVWAVDAWADHVAAMAANGLHLEGASGDRTVALAGAVTSPAELPAPMDLVILATKAGQVTPAAQASGPLLGPGTPVLSIQNGLGGPDQAAAVLGADRVVIGVVGGFGASMRGPGHAHHNGMELVRLGEYAGVGRSERVERLAEVWRAAGFTVATYDDVHQLVWEKLICNVAFSGPCSLTGLTVGETLADPEAWAISATCAKEAWDIAKAKGIAVHIEEPVSYVAEFGSKIPGARPSLLLDHLAGRRSEIDVINGAIPREAAALGLSAPANTVVTALVTLKERAFPA